MALIRVDESTRLPEKTVVCLGFFDGVHKGHLQLVHTAVGIAERNKLVVCAHTFDRAPAEVLRPGLHAEPLTTLEEKARLLMDAGAQIVAVSSFDRKVADTPGADFFREVILGRLNAAHVVAGFHHRFGRGGDTDVKRLAELCGDAGIALSIVAPVTGEDGELVSSTAIREALRRGDIASATRMLGREPGEALIERFKRV